MSGRLPSSSDRSRGRRRGFADRSRSRLPGTIPREESFSRRFLERGVMNTIPYVAFRGKRPSGAWTRGRISVRVGRSIPPRDRAVRGAGWGWPGRCIRTPPLAPERCARNWQAAVSSCTLCQLEQVPQQHLGKAVTTDDPPAARSSPLFREGDLLSQASTIPTSGARRSRRSGADSRVDRKDFASAGFPFLPGGVQMSSRFVLAVLGHFRFPFGRRLFRKIHHLRLGHGERVSGIRATDKVHPFPWGSGPAGAVRRIDLASDTAGIGSSR